MCQFKIDGFYLGDQLDLLMTAWSVEEDKNTNYGKKFSLYFIVLETESHFSLHFSIWVVSEYRQSCTWI